MPFFPTTHFPRHHLAQSLGAACIARLWLGFAWLVSLSLCRLASLGFARLGSLGFTQLSSAHLASLGLRRLAQPRILAPCSHHWLAACITGSHHSGRVCSRCLARVARLASRAKRHLALLDLRRWLARVVAGLLHWRCSLSRWCLRSALITRHFARPHVASLGLVSLACVAGSLIALLAPVTRLASAHLALLGLCCFARL